MQSLKKVNTGPQVQNILHDENKFSHCLPKENFNHVPKQTNHPIFKIKDSETKQIKGNLKKLMMIDGRKN